MGIVVISFFIFLPVLLLKFVFKLKMGLTFTSSDCFKKCYTKQYKTLLKNKIQPQHSQKFECFLMKSAFYLLSNFYHELMLKRSNQSLSGELMMH